MDFNDADRALLLAGLFELRITHIENEARCIAIDSLAVRLGGDLSEVFFGGQIR